MNLAWRLDFGAGMRAAVAFEQQIQLFHDAPLQDLAFAPQGASQVLLWQGLCVPVVDMVQQRSVRHPGQNALVGLYATSDGVGALHLVGPSVKVQIQDGQCCELPDGQTNWRGLALACYWDAEYGATPIIDLGRVFAQQRLPA